MSGNVSRFALLTTSWDNDCMPNATITVDAALKERLSDLASQSGQRVDEGRVPNLVEKEKWRNLLLTQTDRR
jgi:hypothetical protein